jgi:hypothetical protein
MKNIYLPGFIFLLTAALCNSCTCQYSYFLDNTVSPANRYNKSSVYVNVVPNGITNELYYYKLLVAVPYDKSDPRITRSKGSKICFVGTTDTIYSTRVGDSERYSSPTFKKYIRQKKDLVLITSSELDSLGFITTITETYILKRAKTCSFRIAH